MLKIKDNIDLKELEKFGFRVDYIGGNKRYVFYKDIGNTEIYNLKIGIDRTIHINILSIHNVLDNVIYDLIKADLVEKV